MPDERERRLPGWQPGVPIRLADGQEWHFRKPRVRFRVELDPDGRPVARRFAPEHGTDYVDLLERMLRATDDAEYFALVAGLAIDLLKLNYDLKDEDIPGLFQYELDDPASAETWLELRLLVSGVAPKRSAVG